MKRVEGRELAKRPMGHTGRVVGRSLPSTFSKTCHFGSRNSCPPYWHNPENFPSSEPPPWTSANPSSPTARNRPSRTGPTRWPWLLVTQSVHTDCKGQEGRTYDQCLTPLLMDCILAVKGKKEEDFPVILEHTVAGTVWIMPNEKGGMTVMKPEDY